MKYPSNDTVGLFGFNFFKNDMFSFPFFTFIVNREFSILVTPAFKYVLVLATFWHFCYRLISCSMVIGYVMNRPYISYYIIINYIYKTKILLEWQILVTKVIVLGIIQFLLEWIFTFVLAFST